MQEKHKCVAEINYNTGTQMLSRVINGGKIDLCNCNAKYFENNEWLCGKHAPSQVEERRMRAYLKWKEKNNS